MTQTNQTYSLALYLAPHLVQAVSAGLDSRRLHLRDANGRLLLRLDEWVRATEGGRWPGSGNGYAPPASESEKDELRRVSDELGASR
jgi:hypothetical protein